jgi:microcystin-dependent protein
MVRDSIYWKPNPDYTSPAGWMALRDTIFMDTLYPGMLDTIIYFYVDTTFIGGDTIAGVDNMGGTSANVAQHTINITTTISSVNVTTSSTAGIAIGHTVIAANVPTGATVATITSATAFTISVNATASATVSARFSELSNANSLGSTGGDDTHNLTGSESGTSVHLHGVGTLATADNTHDHTFTYTDTAGNVGDSSSPRWDSSNESADATRTVSTLSDNTHRHTVSGSTANATAANAIANHNNMQPTILLNYIIKA